MDRTDLISFSRVCRSWLSAQRVPLEGSSLPDRTGFRRSAGARRQRLRPVISLSSLYRASR
ncbi:hypothetical protein [Rhizobium rhizogenes]|uniref:hypothetical protein n=1 Tax=Rhizobium rhizogenes TaxID=359 RepID=UPI00386BD22C